MTPDDVKALAVPVLAHRLLVTPEAQLQGLSAADVLADVLPRRPRPRRPLMPGRHPMARRPTPRSAALGRGVPAC